MIGKLDETLRFHQTALNLRAQRQELLASNIANADTPNYKARDIDFSKALQGALARSVPASASASASVSGGLTRTAHAHLAATGAAAAAAIGGAPLMYRTGQQGSVDGNTVEMDTERNQFADNALRYEAGLTLINAQIKGLLTAIQG